MRKLGITLAAIGLFFTAIQAQVVEDVEAIVKVETELEITSKEFEKIAVSLLPEEVTAAIVTEYPNALTRDAFVKVDDEEVIYKVKLDINGQEKKVYLDAKGHWIKKENKKEESN